VKRYMVFPFRSADWIKLRSTGLPLPAQLEPEDTHGQTEHEGQCGESPSLHAFLQGAEVCIEGLSVLRSQEIGMHYGIVNGGPFAIQ
jgi:hypothetical protein